MSEDFDVSRVVVREALQQLAHDGLVVQNSYKGTNVVKLLSKEVSEILTVRVLLESEAVREAKKKLTDKDKKDLKKMVKELDSTEDPFRRIELDFKFHQKLWELSGNETLKKILIHLSSPFFAMAVIVWQSKQLNSDSDSSKVGKHAKLLDALINGETEEAVSAMREHIEQNQMNTGKDFDEFVETKSA